MHHLFTTSISIKNITNIPNFRFINIFFIYKTSVRFPSKFTTKMKIKNGIEYILTFRLYFSQYKINIARDVHRFSDSLVWTDEKWIKLNFTTFFVTIRKLCDSNLIRNRAFLLPRFSFLYFLCGCNKISKD